MYRIRGADGQDYGPADVGQVRAWIADNRADGNTLVCLDGTTDWKPLREFPELAVLLGGPPPPLPRPVSSPLAGKPTSLSPVPARTDGLAVTALILGILGFFTCGITGLPGFICGLVSQARIRRNEGQLRGKEMALAGMIVSGVSLICLPVLAAMLIPGLAKAKGKAQQTVCINNMKQIGLAARIYSTDNRDLFPSAAKWCDQLHPMLPTPSVLVCPSEKGQRRLSYAFNEKLGGQEDGKVNPQTVMFFECNRDGWNTSGGKELLPSQPPHGEGVVVCFADGSVQVVPPGRLPSLRWDP